MPLGVVAALPAEAEALAGRSVSPGRVVEAGARTLVYLAGAGHARASLAAAALLEHGARALVSWGIAGGLDPALRPGDLVLPERVIAPDGSAYAVDPGWHRALVESLGPAACSCLLESETVIVDAAAKGAAFRATGAAAVDMESASVAAAAAESGVPFVAIRVVCDAAQDPIPKVALRGVDAEGRALPLGILGALLRDPGQLGSLLKLRRSFRAARDELRRVARSAGPDLFAQSSG